MAKCEINFNSQEHKNSFNWIKEGFPEFSDTGIHDTIASIVNYLNRYPETEKEALDNVFIAKEVLEADSKLSRAKVQFQIEMAQEQISNLKKFALKGAKGAQADTIKSLITMIQDYLDYLNELKIKESKGENIQAQAARSVSQVKGSTTFTNSEEYEHYKLFGQFVHFFQEKVVERAYYPKEASTKSKKNAQKTFLDYMTDRQVFNEILEEWNKNPKKRFILKAEEKTSTEKVIHGLTEDKLFEMVQEMGMLASNRSSDPGSIIIPELIVFGKNKHGKRILGRADMVVVQSDGSVKVIDFKTKKIDKPTSTLTEQRAMSKLASSRYTVNSVGTDPIFQNESRAVFDDWAIQTEMYKRLLAQNKVKVQDVLVSTLVYSATKGSIFQDSINVISSMNNLYYNYVNLSESSKEINSRLSRYAKTIGKVEEYIPLDPDQENKGYVAPKLNLFGFDIQDQSWTKLKKILADIVERNKREVYTKRQEAQNNNDEELTVFYNDLYNAFSRFQESVDQDNPSAVASVKFEMTLLNLESVLLSALKESDTLTELFNKMDKIIQENSSEITSEYSEILTKSRSIAKGVYDILPIYELMKQVLNEARSNQLVNENTPAVKRVRELGHLIEEFETRTRKIESYSVALVIAQINKDRSKTKTENVKALDELQKQIDEALDPKIAILEKEREKILSETSPSLVKLILRDPFTYASALWNKEKLKGYSEPERLKAAQIEKLDKTIEKLKIQKKFPSLMKDPASIAQMLEEISDPGSMFFIGAPLDVNEQVSSKLSALDNFIAPTQNANPLIAAHSILLKNFEMMSRYSVNNDSLVREFDKKTQERAAKRGSTENSNKGLTERRQIIKVDKEGNINKEDTELTLINPKSQSFEERIKTFEIQLKKFRDQNKELNAQLREAKSEEDKLEKKKLIKKLSDERNATIKAFRTFEMKFTHTPYKKIFYEYIIGLNDDISEDMRDLLEQYRSIAEKHGKFSDELRLRDYRKKHEVQDVTEEELDEISDEESLTDYEIMNNILVEINKLKEKTKNNTANQKAIDSFKKLFEFRINYNLYKRIYAQKDALYSDRNTNPESMRLFQDWLDENSIITPTDQWYEEISKTFEIISQYGAEDPEMGDLIKRRSELLKRYKTNYKIVDPRYISEEDQDELNKIENEIENIKNNREKSGSIDKDLKKAFDRLRVLRSKKNNPLYVKDLEIRTQGLRKAYQVLKDAEAEIQANYSSASASKQAQDKYDYARKQFSIKEKEYKAWYDRNHTNTYTSIALSDPQENAQPKSFNMLWFPADELMEVYTTRQPAKKYTYKILKDEVRNENYQESLDGGALPIALKREGDVITLNDEYLNNPLISEEDKRTALSYVNDNYKALLKNQEDFDYYKTMTALYFSHQRKISGKVLGYTVPGMNKTITEVYKNNPLDKALKIRAKEFYDNNIRIKSEDDFMMNTFNDNPNMSIRNRYSSQYQADLQSDDAISAIRAWVIESHYNRAMADINPISDAFVEGLRSMAEKLKIEADRAPNLEQKKILDGRFRNLESAIAVAEAEREKYIRGFTDEQDARAFKKASTNLMRLFSIARIGFDVANQTKNFLSGNVQTFINAYSSVHWGEDDLKWAKGQIYGNFLRKYIRSWGKVDDVDPEVQLYRMSQPSQNDIRKYALDIAGSKNRRLMNKVLSVQELAYMLQDKGDKEIAMTIWLAIMHNKKVRVIDENNQPVLNEDGSQKLMSLYEAVEVDKDGKINIKYNADTTLDEVVHYTMIAQSEIIRTQGNYAASDSTRAERFLLGAWAFFYRKYLVPMFANRLGNMRPNWVTNEVHQGYYRSITTIYKYYGSKEFFKALLYSGALPKRFLDSTDMNSFYSRKMIHLSRDLMTGITLAVLVLMSQAYLNSIDDDDEVDMITGNMIRILWGVERETLSMNPLPVFGGADEYIRNFTTLTSLTREFQLAFRSIAHVLSLGLVKALGDEAPVEDPDGLFEELYNLMHRWSYYSRKSGTYEAGDPKALKDFHDLTGIKNLRDLFNPAEKLESMSKTYF